MPGFLKGQPDLRVVLILAVLTLAVAHASFLDRFQPWATFFSFLILGAGTILAVLRWWWRNFHRDRNVQAEITPKDAIGTTYLHLHGLPADLVRIAVLVRDGRR